MIAQDTLRTHIRRLLGDQDARTYSDYDLTYALTDALSYLSRTCALTAGDLTLTTVTLRANDTLPDDLISLVRVTDLNDRPLKSATDAPLSERTYRIEDNTLLAQTPVRLTYHRDLAARAESDPIDLASTAQYPLARLSALTLLGADDAAKDAALKEARTLLARRNRTKRTLYQPWKV